MIGSLTLSSSCRIILGQNPEPQIAFDGWANSLFNGPDNRGSQRLKKKLIWVDCKHSIRLWLWYCLLISAHPPPCSNVNSWVIITALSSIHIFYLSGKSKLKGCRKNSHSYIRPVLVDLSVCLSTCESFQSSSHWSKDLNIYFILTHPFLSMALF